ncbi:MAG: retron-type reverse transcriptase [Pirellulaceae bacterium]|jgi:retron-type reverse transcriptase
MENSAIGRKTRLDLRSTPNKKGEPGGAQNANHGLSVRKLIGGRCELLYITSASLIRQDAKVQKSASEGDVKSCFDEISDKAILRCLQEKIQDKPFLSLSTRQLKSGVSIDGKVHPTEHSVRSLR